ncbi:MAG: 50S ribosomal protein L1 [Deltaproteobacteria bacterium RIFCSPLOWO2_12_FULL_43_16]|nr:MAG: 50S ribosomal protein L1 [Deltaproteobacteria bacterium GWA2_43_19]OGQ09881.1 MAG: 50S ribosomal protein L1 [Deltaproteobacteria bacterium RIFCSPHIGHO2_02_FULL_43_33]OGQ35004.1 MAG: 50S ribosomal protein L1 [Deltaproteobacteria bacterium RIFCSPLOWO2_01_FULL_42_9]OGQ60917.1 MAG: 50S ribosomal protein L1 [Deltaproteobacteria bacterium RIFCSPLOWO2_12_FULL_43_16]HBR17053.1 50S ribosomal protein L1 [Deltaproteobacteria bacterium]
MGKKFNAAIAKVDSSKLYNLDDAVKLVPETTVAKFDETVDLAVRLGVDPKQPEQMVRGTVVLPNGTGKKVRVLVFAKGEKEKEAKDAGADFVGGDDLIEKVSKGWLDFDSIVATPDMMGAVGKLGKVLGPRGLMPNPKLGTVTFDVARAVKEVKAGKIEFKVDKSGNMHVPIGKVSFGVNKLKENLTALLETVVKAKPSTSKGTYLKSITISTTMGPGIKIDAVGVRELFK